MRYLHLCRGVFAGEGLFQYGAGADPGGGESVGTAHPNGAGGYCRPVPENNASGAHIRDAAGTADAGGSSVFPAGETCGADRCIHLVIGGDAEHSALGEFLQLLFVRLGRTHRFRDVPLHGLGILRGDISPGGPGRGTVWSPCGSGSGTGAVGTDVAIDGGVLFPAENGGGAGAGGLRRGCW